jgi:hypothetical protein
VLYPETFFFHFNTVKGKAEVVPHEDTWDFDGPPPFDLDIKRVGLANFFLKRLQSPGKILGKELSRPWQKEREFFASAQILPSRKHSKENSRVSKR